MTAKKPRRKCVCTAPIDASGRCTATPSCSDFRKPAQSLIERQAAARQREREGGRPIGITRGKNAGGAQ